MVWGGVGTGRSGDRLLSSPLYPSAWRAGETWREAAEPRLQALACIEAWRGESGLRRRYQKERNLQRSTF